MISQNFIYKLRTFKMYRLVDLRFSDSEKEDWRML